MTFNKHVDTILLFILIFVSFIPKDKYVFGAFFAISTTRFAVSLYSLSSNKSNKLQKNIIHLLLFFLISLFIYCFKDASLYGFLMYAVSGLYFYFILFSYSNTRYSTLDYIIKKFHLIVYFQALLIIIKAPAHDFTKGDWATGTTNNAHIIGFMLAVVIIQLVFDYFYIKKNKSSLLKIIYLSLTLWLADANQLLLAILFSLFFVLFIKSNYSFKSKIGTILITLVLIFSMGYYKDNYGSLIQNFDNIQKIKGYKTLFELYSDEPLSVIFGTSVGTYSSRAAVALSSNQYLAKPSGNRLPIQHTSPYIKKYFSNLYSPEYYEKLLKMGVTGTFYVPFSTVLSIIAEYGILGIILVINLILIMKKRISYLKKIDMSLYYQIFSLSITYLILFLYDNWLEYPNAVFPFLLILMKGLKKVDITEAKHKKKTDLEKLAT